jgi:hypothetical protein
MVADAPAGEIVVDGVYGALWESIFLLLSLKYKKPRKKAGAPRDRHHTATAIAKTTGLWHLKHWEQGRRNATAGSFLRGASTAIATTNATDLPLFLHFYFSVKFSLFFVTLKAVGSGEVLERSHRA